MSHCQLSPRTENTSCRICESPEVQTGMTIAIWIAGNVRMFFFAAGRGFFPVKPRQDAPWRCLHNGYPSARGVPGVAPPQHLHQQSDGPSGRDPAGISELRRSQRVQQMGKHSDIIRCFFFFKIWPNNPQKLPLSWLGTKNGRKKRLYKSWAKYAK